jgi:hypothetical protein
VLDNADGLPIGLQIIGHRFDDLGALRIARAYETLRPPPRSWPAPRGRDGLLRSKRGEEQEGADSSVW